MSCTLKRRDIAWGAVTTGLPPVGLIDLIKDIHQWTGLVLLRDCADLLQPGGFAECAKKGAALRLCAAKPDPLAQNDRPGEEAGEREQPQDGQRDWTAGSQHLQDGIAAGVRGRQWDTLVIALKEQEDR